jgi:hypothetical protein
MQKLATFLVSLMALNCTWITRADESELHVVFDHDGAAFINISDSLLLSIAEENKLGSAEKWPLYMDTQLPNYILPAKLAKMAKEHPSWGDLNDYHVVFTTYKEGDHAQRLLFFYRADVKVLFVLRENMEKKSDDPNSPF